MSCFGYRVTYDPDTGDSGRDYFESDEDPCDHDDCDPI